MKNSSHNYEFLNTDNSQESREQTLFCGNKLSASYPADVILQQKQMEALWNRLTIRSGTTIIDSYYRFRVRPRGCYRTDTSVLDGDVRYGRIQARNEIINSHGHHSKPKEQSSCSEWTGIPLQTEHCCEDWKPLRRAFGPIPAGSFAWVGLR
jgi:hypothetical protein